MGATLLIVRKLTALIAVPLMVAGAEAGAFRNAADLSERPLETAEGSARITRPGAGSPPTAAQAARWQRFTAAHGAWRALWDADTAVPARIWGEGVAAPGANRDPARAEQAARALLAAHLELLAPGSRLDDWALVANVTHGRGGALRTVGFAQRASGVPVAGGAVSFLFKRDRMIVIGSEARPDVAVVAPAHAIDDRTASAAAREWLASLHGGAPTVRSIGGVSILPIVRGPGAIEYRAVVTVQVELDAPRGRWDVHVDAATGRPVARAQRLRFGAGTLVYEAPIRNLGGGTTTFAAAHANLIVAGSPLVSSATGTFGFAGPGPVSVAATVDGPRLAMSWAGNPSASTMLTVVDGGTATWTTTDPGISPQLSAFTHLGRVATFAKALDPGAAWIETPLPVNVNMVGQCNAYSDDDGLHFLREGATCANAAMFADIVYHEYGHQLHAHAIIAGAGAYDFALSDRDFGQPG